MKLKILLELIWMFSRMILVCDHLLFTFACSLTEALENLVAVIPHQLHLFKYIYFFIKIDFAIFDIKDFIFYQSYINKPNVMVAVISAKKHKRQRRKRQSVTAKRENSQTPKVLTAIRPLPNLT